MLELLSNIADVATQASVMFYIVLWVILLMINFAYYHK